MDHSTNTRTDTVKNSQDSAASQGARRATEEAAESASNLAPGAQVEVLGRATRRRFSGAQKRRILEAADRCTQPGEIGALLRSEGIYSSSLSTWRRQREKADLVTLAPQRRGPKIDPHRLDQQHIARLTRENQNLHQRLEKAQLVIEVQKKVSALLALIEAEHKPESN